MGHEGLRTGNTHPHAGGTVSHLGDPTLTGGNSCNHKPADQPRYQLQGLIQQLRVFPLTQVEAGISTGFLFRVSGTGFMVSGTSLFHNVPRIFVMRL